ncbi:6-carboxytetrahydropterin synthase [Armatimonas sp.]|uniref:6-carboxytetrahydropterin synthase n=1 Tax=Armatimonas sp. TaxID=1872638 RepID=UPI00374DC99F
MAQLALRRKAMFSAAHAYWFPDRSDEENRALFGKWASKWGHGHNYDVEVTVIGELDESSGMVVNITDVDRALKRALKPLRDKHLTYEVPHFATHPPTTENIALFLADAFSREFVDPAARLSKITVWETPTLSATLDFQESDTMVALTRSIDFAAAHRLHAPGLSESENLAIFGKCNNPKGHGHNYGVEITVIGEPDLATGMIVDLLALDAVLEREIMARYDHKHLNDDTEDFRAANPTSENLTLAIWRHLVNKIPAPARLQKVVVRETDRNFFEYTGL